MAIGAKISDANNAAPKIDQVYIQALARLKATATDSDLNRIKWFEELYDMGHIELALAYLQEYEDTMIEIKSAEHLRDRAAELERNLVYLRNMAIANIMDLEESEKCRLLAEEYMLRQ